MILELRSQGGSRQAIAPLVGCHVSCVYDVLNPEKRVAYNERRREHWRTVTAARRVPAAEMRSVIERELEWRRDHWDRPGEFAYRGGADLLLRHGRFFQGRPTPSKYRGHVGEPLCCFRNAAHVALAESGLRYCEGVYGTPQGLSSHAWCLDEADRVVEVTLPTGRAGLAATMRSWNLEFTPIEQWGYWGAVFDASAALDYFADLGVYSAPLLDRHEREIADVRGDWPVLRKPYGEPMPRILRAVA